MLLENECSLQPWGCCPCSTGASRGAEGGRGAEGAALHLPSHHSPSPLAACPPQTSHVARPRSSTLTTSLELALATVLSFSSLGNGHIPSIFPTAFPSHFPYMLLQCNNPGSLAAWCGFTSIYSKGMIQTLAQLLRYPLLTRVGKGSTGP